MLLIRKFEEKLLNLFREGLLNGTTHTCIGQEAIGVTLIDQIEANDIVVSNHRCHGHYIAKTGDTTGLLAEIMGKDGGPCQGRGGSQHIFNKTFVSNGVQGNMFPVAAGMAYAEKIKKSGKLVIIFVGDGTLGQGVVYETLNLLGILEIPLLIIIENNGYAQSTSIQNNFNGSIFDRIKGFNISCGESNDFIVNDLYEKFSKILKNIRKNKKAHVEIVNTYRLSPHSTTEYGRPIEEINSQKEKDPLHMLAETIEKEKLVYFDNKVNLYIQSIVDKVNKMPDAKL